MAVCLDRQVQVGWWLLQGAPHSHCNSYVHQIGVRVILVRACAFECLYSTCNTPSCPFATPRSTSSICGCFPAHSDCCERMYGMPLVPRVLCCSCTCSLLRIVHAFACFFMHRMAGHPCAARRGCSSAWQQTASSSCTRHVLPALHGRLPVVLAFRVLAIKPPVLRAPHLTHGTHKLCGMALNSWPCH